MGKWSFDLHSITYLVSHVASWCASWHSSGRGNISFQFFRLSAWDRYPCKSCVTHFLLWKVLLIQSCEVLIQTLTILQPPSRGPEVQVNADQWFHGPLHRPRDEVTVLRYLECGNERPVVCVPLIEVTLQKGIVSSLEMTSILKAGMPKWITVFSVTARKSHCVPLAYVLDLFPYSFIEPFLIIRGHMLGLP